MDRYQFEDLISDYIENNLSLAKRQEFEDFISSNPDCKIQVDEFSSLLSGLKNMPAKATSDDFMIKLDARIKQAKVKNRVLQSGSARSESRIFGFTPLYAGLMLAVVVGIITVGIQLVPSAPGPVLKPAPYVNTANEIPVDQIPELDQSNFAKSEETADDSLEATKTLPDVDAYHQDRMKLVGAQE